MTLYATELQTDFGPMVAIANDNALVRLEFLEKDSLALRIKKLEQKLKVSITQAANKITDQITSEMKDYCAGKLTNFKTPVSYNGTSFQTKVWDALQTIPHGQTCSYADIARKINHPKAFRAVGSTNGLNKLAIIVPCHRVVNADGKLGGYAGGLDRKQCLLDHERKI